MTPVEFSAFVKGFEDREELGRRRDYNLAVLIRAAVRMKRMPKYEGIAKPRKKKHEQMSDEELFKAVQALNRMMGGTED